jgi:hypothetical protein
MMVNEDVENRVINLAVRTTRITAGDLYKALRAYMRHIQNKKQLRQASKDSVTKGKQSVKELVGQGQGVSSMEIGDSGIRDFKRIANKYGVDFAIVKDKNEDPPKYTVFFKAKDADAMTAAFNEYSQRVLRREERPSVLEQLRKIKAAILALPGRVINRDRQREQTR